MKPVLYTPEQLTKFNSILQQRGVDHNRFQAVLRSGILSDIFDPRAELANRLFVRRALDLDPFPSEPGRHVVDFSFSLEEMIQAGNYELKHVDINSGQFPSTRADWVEFEDCLFHFERGVSVDYAIRRIVSHDPENPWEPALLENLLAYGIKNPDKLQEHPILAVRSSGRGRTRTHFAYLYGKDSKRNLDLCWSVFDVEKGARFLAVRRIAPVSES